MPIDQRKVLVSAPPSPHEDLRRLALLAVQAAFLLFQSQVTYCSSVFEQQPRHEPSCSHPSFGEHVYARPSDVFQLGHRLHSFIVNYTGPGVAVTRLPLYFFFLRSSPPPPPSVLSLSQSLLQLVGSAFADCLGKSPERNRRRWKFSFSKLRWRPLPDVHVACVPAPLLIWQCGNPRKQFNSFNKLP